MRTIGNRKIFTLLFILYIIVHLTESIIEELAESEHRLICGEQEGIVNFLFS